MLTSELNNEVEELIAFMIYPINREAGQGGTVNFKSSKNNKYFKTQNDYVSIAVTLTILFKS